MDNEIQDALDEAKTWLILKQSKAGKIVINKLKEDIEHQIGKIAGSYGELTHIQLITEISKLEVRRNLLDNIIGSEEKVKILEEELK